MCYDFGVTTDQYRWRDIVVVCGDGGTRVDAVTAWLNDQQSLTGMVSPKWQINTASGKTTSSAYNHWFFNWFKHGKDFADDLTWLENTYYAQGKQLIQRHHDVEYLDPLLPEHIRQHITYIHIEPGDDRNLVIKQVWEYVVKSILRFPLDTEYRDFGKPVVLAKARRMFYNHLRRRQFFSVPTLKINYKDVVSASGSYVLSQLLDIEITPYQHELWRRGVTAGDSPLKVDFLGYTWCVDELESIYDEVISEYASRQFLTTG